MFLPAVFFNQKNRLNAFSFILTFYAILGLEEIIDIQHFFAIAWTASLLIWFSHCVLMSLPWLIFYTPKISAKGAFFRTFLMLCIFLLPPFGLFIWIQPIAGAGAIFPKSGWIGLAVFIFTCSLLSNILTFIVKNPAKNTWVFYKPIYMLIPVLIFMVFCQINAGFEEKASTAITPVNTHLGKMNLNSERGLMKEMALVDDIHQRLLSPGASLLLPENVRNNLDGTNNLWSSLVSLARARHRLIIVGTDHNLSPHVHVSGFEILGGKHARFVPEIMPMPLGEWRPFLPSKTHYLSHFTTPEIIHLGHNSSVIGLVCYEEMIPYPILMSLFNAHNPLAIVASSNQWFLGKYGKSGYLKQLVTAKSIARLFGLPFIVATNT